MKPELSQETIKRIESDALEYAIANYSGSEESTYVMAISKYTYIAGAIAEAECTTIAEDLIKQLKAAMIKGDSLYFVTKWDDDKSPQEIADDKISVLEARVKELETLIEELKEERDAYRIRFQNSNNPF